MGAKTLVLLFSFVAFINAQITYDFVYEPKGDVVTSGDDEWWRTAIIYQIYPRSFMDSDGDGMGDLQGIIDRLDHLVDMGVDVTWLSPIYKSPGVDQGYDISDYREIDPMFGTLDDLKNLVDKAYSLGIKVFMDLVPDYTSDQIDWFQQSVKRNGTYTDYYMWYDGDKDTPPNNWLSSFNGPAWSWNEERQQWYYHAFTPQQPDLNYNHPDVVQELKDIMIYWLDLNIDGFRVDAVSQLFEDADLRDEPPSGKEGVDETMYASLKHIYTKEQEPTYDIIYQFRAVLDEYNKNVNYSRIMMTEAYPAIAEQAARYYGNDTTNGAQFTFNFNFITDLKSGFTVDDLVLTINKWLSHLKTTWTSNWVLGNHDKPRIASRLGVDNIDAFNMLAAFLPGVQITYMGEEIGMENGNVTCEQGKDPQGIKNCTTYNRFSRDFERTPFQWDDSPNAGFSTNSSTWLPVAPAYKITNVKAQNVPGLKSHYNVYKAMVQFRKNNFKNVAFDSVSLIKLSEKVLQIVRRTDKGHYIYLFNTGDSAETVSIYGDGAEYTVSVASMYSERSAGEILSNPITLQPNEAIVSTGSSNL